MTSDIRFDSPHPYLTNLLSSFQSSELQNILGHLLEKVPALIAVIAEDNSVLFASQYHCQLEGGSDSERVNKMLTDLYSESFCETLRQNKTQELSFEHSVRYKDGSLNAYRFFKSQLFLESHGTVSLLIGLNQSDKHLTRIQLSDYKTVMNHLAFKDPLTGLANRTLFYDRLEKSLSLAKRNGAHFALMLIDLDRFKHVNDSLGKHVGDLYLKHVAGNLCEAVRDTDTVARISGDEFVVILDNIQYPDDIKSVADKLLSAASREMFHEEQRVACTASIGISLFPKDGERADVLLRNADMAMYKAKLAGKNQHKFFVNAMTESAVNYLLLENDLQNAIDNSEIQLYFQPQVNIYTGIVSGLEVLIRWQHKHRGLLLPEHFVPLAEETGLILPLGEWVLTQACGQFSEWLKNGYDFGKISVNVSARQFRTPDFLNKLNSILDKTALPRERLELELTESSTMENTSQSIEMLNRIRQSGISVALDDFGTGYSSLAYLQKFPIQTLKIDKSFVDNVDNDEQNAATAKSVIDLAHNMSLSVIAEGVERETQLHWLREKGCEHVQGYYFAPPVPQAQLFEFMDANTERVGERVRVVNERVASSV